MSLQFQIAHNETEYALLVTCKVCSVAMFYLLLSFKPTQKLLIPENFKFKIISFLSNTCKCFLLKSAVEAA